MATRPYTVVFGASAVSGLAPTFVTFKTITNANATPPSISEIGTSGLYLFQYDASLTQIAFSCWGATTSLSFSDQYVYGFLDPQDTFGVTLNAAYAAGVTGVALGTTSVALGTSNIALGTTAVALGNTAVALGITAVAIGTSNIALGTTMVAIGTTILSQVAFGSSLMFLVGDNASLIGNDVSDPTTVFGFLKRAMNTREGDENYTKATGVLQIYDLTGATLLRTQTISDTATNVTRTT